jgi:hypothetical protein
MVVSLVGCTSDDGDPGATGGKSGATGGGSGTGGSSSTGGTGGGTGGGAPAGTVCANPIPVDAAKPGIADFDSYDGVAELTKWSFPLGGDMANMVYAGIFGYGDNGDNKPETFELATGNGSKYAMRVADTMATEYGGGDGIWLSACLNASKLTGISFFAKGNTPDGKATFTLSMGDTTPATAAKPDDKIGTCPGDAMACVHPTFVFPVSADWTEVKIPWSAFTAGNANGALIKPDGKNIIQVQWGAALVWAETPVGSGKYMPTPAPYDLAVDTVSFY